MEYAEHVAAVERELSVLVAALGAGPVDVPVPTCPEWLLGDLIVHVGEFTGWWTHVLCEGAGVAKTPFPDPPSGPALTDWYTGVAASLVATLRATAPDVEIWAWAGDDHTARFAARRCAHELAVHRFDAQSARGAPEGIDPVLAADGIEEIFVMMGARPRSGKASGETLHLCGTDREDQWLVTLGPDRVDVDRAGGTAAMTLRGAVSDLELLLYRRPPIADVQRSGDEAVLDAWYGEFLFG